MADDLLRGDSATAAWPLFQGADDGSIPISPLQLKIYKIDPRLAQDLNHKWHSVLPDTFLGNLVGQPTTVFYGAEFANRWYAVAIWTTPVAANRLTGGWSCLELRRFAISPQAPKNTASRLLRVMTLLIQKEFPAIIRLISYQALDYHKGTIYKAAGWSQVAVSDFMPWDSPKTGRSHSTAQIESAKARWEKQLKKNIDVGRGKN